MNRKRAWYLHATQTLGSPSCSSACTGDTAARSQLISFELLPVEVKCPSMSLSLEIYSKYWSSALKTNSAKGRACKIKALRTQWWEKICDPEGYESHFPIRRTTAQRIQLHQFQHVNMWLSIGTIVGTLLKKDLSSQNALLTPYTPDNSTPYCLFILKKGAREPNWATGTSPAHE